MRWELTVQVGADGVLNLAVPLGREDANKTVRVVLETVETPAGPVSDPEEWRRFIERTSGKWQGEFVREPEGDYEKRDPL